MIKVTFTLIGPYSLVKYKNYTFFDASKKTIPELKSQLKFLTKFNQLKVFNLSPLYYKELKDLTFENEVVILSELVYPGLNFEILDPLPLKSYNAKSFFKSKTIFEWYFFYLKKGVLSPKLEPYLSKLNWKE